MLQFIADKVARQRAGVVVPDVAVDLRPLVIEAGDAAAQQRTKELIAACHDRGLIEYNTMGDPPPSMLTPEGVEYLESLATEATRGRFERFLRRESAVRGVTWGVALLVMTLLITLAALIVSIVK